MPDGLKDKKGDNKRPGGKLDVPESIELLEARIRKLQRDNEPLIAVANELHSQVLKLTEDYEKVVNMMSRKLLALDKSR